MLKHNFPEHGVAIKLLKISKNKIAGNSFEECSFSRKVFHARSFLGYFSKFLYRVLATD